MVRGATLHKFGDGRESVPRTVRASLWLLIGGYVVGLALSPFDPRPWPRVPDKSTLIIAGILGIGIIWGIVFIASQAYRGRRWARWILLIAQVAAIPGSIKDIHAHFGTAPAVSSVYILVFFAELVSVGLLFTPSANLWYYETDDNGLA